MNDDLCVGTLFAHRIATGTEQTEVTVPVIAVIGIGVHAHVAQAVHDFVTHLDEIRCRTGVFERLQHSERPFHAAGACICPASTHESE